MTDILTHSLTYIRNLPTDSLTALGKSSVTQLATRTWTTQVLKNQKSRATQLATSTWTNSSLTPTTIFFFFAAEVFCLEVLAIRSGSTAAKTEPQKPWKTTWANQIEGSPPTTATLNFPRGPMPRSLHSNIIFLFALICVF